MRKSISLAIACLLLLAPLAHAGAPVLSKSKGGNASTAGPAGGLGPNSVADSSLSSNVALLSGNQHFTGNPTFDNVISFGSDVNMTGGSFACDDLTSFTQHLDIDTQSALILRMGFSTGNSNDTTGTFIELDRSQNTGPSLIIDAQGTAPGTNYFTDSAAGSVRIKGTDGDGLYLGGNSSASGLKLDSSRNATIGGDAIIGTLGKGLQVKTGSNAKLGSSALSSGSVIVSNTSVTANSYIFLTDATAGGTLGQLSYSKSNGVGFTITSSNVLDTSTINWFIVEAAP